MRTRQIERREMRERIKAKLRRSDFEGERVVYRDLSDGPLLRRPDRDRFKRLSEDVFRISWKKRVENSNLEAGNE